MPRLGHRAASMERARAFFNGCVLVIDFYFRWLQGAGFVSTPAAGHMCVSIRKIWSCRANGRTRKCCRN